MTAAINTVPSPTGGGRLPVTVVTGFLGAGKTTLLRELLLHGQQRLAVLVNEFGEVGLDGDLLRGCGFCPEEEIDSRLVELANGCLCCTVQEDFLPTMQQLLQRADQLDGILVETSGLALPEPLVAAFGWPEIRARTRVNGVVTVVDGEAVAAGSVVADPAALEAQRLADPSLDHATAIDELFAEQLECADLVLVSRADGLDAAGLQRVRQRVEGLVRPGTPILPMERGHIDPSLVLGLGDPSQGVQTPDHDTGPDHDHDHHDHSHVAVEAVAIRLQGTWPRAVVEAAVQSLSREQGLLRVKGRAWLPRKARPLVIQTVGPRFDSWFEAADGDGISAAAGQAPGLELVLLGFSLDQAELQKALLRALQQG
ncbi:cobalamin biosynthesis protein CobW [Cyanobium sp. PCC 7001]|uniref:cobalamin biosynthesis protein CobW n=1 Tax=Cyanobium sp. PCC 7001 TaxID=180281 RepID=UPI00068168A2